MNAMSSFRCKVSTSKWKFTQKDKDENVKLRTHNLMDGGELSVPDNEYERFLRVCADPLVYTTETPTHITPEYRKETTTPTHPP